MKHRAPHTADIDAPLSLADDETRLFCIAVIVFAILAGGSLAWWACAHIFRGPAHAEAAQPFTDTTEQGSTP